MRQHIKIADGSVVVVSSDEAMKEGMVAVMNGEGGDVVGVAEDGLEVTSEGLFCSCEGDSGRTR
jgi:hypothetical protein